MYDNQLSARRGHFGLPSTFCLQMGRARGNMFADDRPQTTQTAVRHAMTRGETGSPTFTRNSPGSDGVTSLTNYQRARMASPASQDTLTYDLQPNPTSPSLTISYFILVLPVASSPPSTTHHKTLSTLRNVSHIARCIIPQLITSPATLSIRPGVIPRVSVAAHCSIVHCIEKAFTLRRGI